MFTLTHSQKPKLNAGEKIERIFTIDTRKLREKNFLGINEKLLFYGKSRKISIEAFFSRIFNLNLHAWEKVLKIPKKYSNLTLIFYIIHKFVSEELENSCVKKFSN